jgi:hypothetical protein
MSERRAGLEKAKARAEPAVNGRRPGQPAVREDPSRAGREVGKAYSSWEASNDRGAKGPSVQGSGPKEQERERLARA